MGKIKGYPVRPGMFDKNGATVMPVGINFTIHTHHGTRCELLLYHRGEDKPFVVLPFPESYRVGDVYSMIVFGLEIQGLEYAYRVDGKYQPSHGYLYNKNNVLLDPYARAVAGQRIWGDRKQGPYRARVVEDDYDWENSTKKSKEISDLIIYELHVRGFTKHESSGVDCPGTFAGLKQKIPYLKELGINAVELMPIFEFDEVRSMREYKGQVLYDYWGYNPVSFFAPNTSYTHAEEYNQEGKELKDLIKEFHENGIEVILDVVFNHTAEGNEKGPIFSFKGFDNRIYYMLTPDGYYYNFSGCGNTLNCNHPVVQQMILECLRHWTINYHIDGFRFDLASILGRNEDGSPMNNPPLLRSLAYDPILSNVKLIAEAWDAGGMYQVGRFPASKRWAEWNGRYRDSVRGFLKGDNWDSAVAVQSILGSVDLYGEFESKAKGDYAGYDSCINFLTCHDGFTMHDLYSYNEKHNEANGWNNTDGANDNRSWNCGAEGETDNWEVLQLRERMIRNAFTVLMCSRGTPMFLAGDEFGNTQFGNNNSYCQDNLISWLDWSMLEKNKNQFEFFKFMIDYRHKHPTIRKKLPDAVCGLNSTNVFNAEGVRGELAGDERTVGVSFAGYDEEKGGDDVVYIAINTYWKDTMIKLPEVKGRGKWYLTVNTFGDGNQRYYYPEGQEIAIDYEFIMKPRSVAVFTRRDC
ncbi:MAG: alpha-amylase family glycosyl hydrolase [Eubacteriales bacterium]|nr:alpha-amylase family glycosyl hydrolase [Eubacteriales bacterium]